MGAVRMTDDRLEWHLSNWAAWMQRGNGVLGYKILAVYGANGSRHLQDWEEEMDDYCARATDACLQDLEPVERCAVEHQWLQAVFRFRPGVFDASLSSAAEKLKKFLDRKGIW